jgi:D-inositol-3-phosphate glycosyltransferase
MKKLALISYHSSPLAMLGGKDAGGMNVFVRETALEFARQGFDVDVFTRSTSQSLLRIDSQLGKGARVIHVPAGPESPVPKHELINYVPDFTDWVCKFSKGSFASSSAELKTPQKYDIIHAHYWLSGLVAEHLKHCWGAPFVHTFHTLAELKNQIAARDADLESEERIRNECHLCLTADRLTAATQVEWEQLVHVYGAPSSRIRIVPPGVDLSRFHPIEQSYAQSVIGAPENHRILLFAGRIEPLKGIDTLFRAIALLRDRGASCALCGISVVIVGGDPSVVGLQNNAEMARLHTLRDDLMLNDVIDFIGAQDQDTLHYFYSAADCVIMPSHYESFGMVALEAMACGTPVIASDVGGLSVLVRDGENGFLVPPRSPEILAEHIEQLLNNEPLRRRIGHRASCYAEDFSWTKIVGRLLGVYNELL